MLKVVQVYIAAYLLSLFVQSLYATARHALRFASDADSSRPDVLQRYPVDLLTSWDDQISESRGRDVCRNSRGRRPCKLASLPARGHVRDQSHPGTPRFLWDRRGCMDFQCERLRRSPSDGGADSRKDSASVGIFSEQDIRILAESRVRRCPT